MGHGSRSVVWMVAGLLAVVAPAVQAQTASDGDAGVVTQTQSTTRTGQPVYGVDAADFGAVPDDGIDDSFAIQAALDDRAPITRIMKPGTYIIGANRQLVSFAVGYHVATLTIRSFKTLECGPGVVIKLANYSNCLMLANVNGSGGDVNVKIDGGTWDANGNYQDMRGAPVPVTVFGGSGGYRPYWHGAAMQIGMCRNLRIQNLTVKNAKKYAVYVAGGSDIHVNNLSFDTMSDGVHLNGPARNVKISNIRGFCHDNMIAIIASEGAYYPEITGDAITTARNIAGLEISDIVCGLPGKPTFQPIRFTGRATDTISNVRISRVSGDGSLAGHGIAFSDDNSDCDPGPDVYPAGLEHTIMRDIVVEDVSLKVTTNYALFQIGGSGVKDLTIRRVTQESPLCSLVLVNNNADLESLTIEDVTAPDNHSKLVNIEAKAKNVTLRNCAVQSSDIARVLQIATGGHADNVLVEDCGFIGGAQQIMQWWDTGPVTLTLRRNMMVTGLTAVQTMDSMKIVSDKNVWQVWMGLAAVGAGRIDLTGSGDICVLPIGIEMRGRGVRVNNPDLKVDAYLLTPMAGDRVYNINPHRDQIPAGMGVLTCIKAGAGLGGAKWGTSGPTLSHTLSKGAAVVRGSNPTPVE